MVIPWPFIFDIDVLVLHETGDIKLSENIYLITGLYTLFWLFALSATFFYKLKNRFFFRMFLGYTILAFLYLLKTIIYTIDFEEPIFWSRSIICIALILLLLNEIPFVNKRITRHVNIRLNFH
jgi:hypothetical protein